MHRVAARFHVKTKREAETARLQWRHAHWRRRRCGHRRCCRRRHVALVLGSATGLGDNGGSETVYVSVPAGNGGGQATSAAELPALGNSFDPAAIYAARAGGVVTIYAEIASSGISQGSGFVVDDEGTILTNAHVITNVGDEASAGSGGGACLRRVQRRRAPSCLDHRLRPLCRRRRVRVESAGHRLAPLPLGDSSASSSARRSPRSEAPSATRARSRSVSSPPQAIDSLPDVALRRRGCNPDRRADQPWQLGRAAARRPRPRDRVNAQIRSNCGTPRVSALRSRSTWRAARSSSWSRPVALPMRTSASSHRTSRRDWRGAFGWASPVARSLPCRAGNAGRPRWTAWRDPGGGVQRPSRGSAET